MSAQLAPARRVQQGVRRALLLLVCVLVGLHAGPTRAEAAEKSIWGPATLPDGSSAFPLYRRLGVDTYQTSVTWSGVATRRPRNPRNPRDPAYRWDPQLDRTIRQARRHGIDVALLVYSTPSWANGGRDARWAPTRPRDYAAFAAASSARYPSVRRWMILGEPTRGAQFQPLPPGQPEGPRRYARILDAAYGALKARSSRNIVIGGMTFSAGDVSPSDWVRFMRLPSGRPPRLDWFGHNPFSNRFPDLANRPYDPSVRDFSDLDTLAGEIRRAYRPLRRRPPLWLSEFTVQSDGGGPEFNFYVSREDQARWITAAYRIADRAPYVKGLGWITLLDDPETPGSAHLGLLTHALEPKPSYYAYLRAPGERSRSRRSRARRP